MCKAEYGYTHTAFTIPESSAWSWRSVSSFIVSYAGSFDHQMQTTPPDRAKRVSSTCAPPAPAFVLTRRAASAPVFF